MLNTSVVICTYSEARWDFLAAAVESVRRQTVPPLEIIVSVDHNQTLLDRVRGRWLDVVAVENHETRGLSGARNSGIAAARGEVIAFLDDDAAAAPDWLEQLQRGYADENVLGVGGTIQPVWLGHQPKWLPREFYWVVGCTYEGVPTTSAPIRNMIGANMSLRGLPARDWTHWRTPSGLRRNRAVYTCASEMAARRLSLRTRRPR